MRRPRDYSEGRVLACQVECGSLHDGHFVSKYSRFLQCFGDDLQVVGLNHRTPTLDLTGGFEVSRLAGAGFAGAVEANLIIDPFCKERHTRIDIKRIGWGLVSGSDTDLYVLLGRGTVKQQRDTRI
jgi:hypothetical protein